MIAAIIVAVVADGLQFSLGPVGWAFSDQVIDVIAMLITIRLLGFHWLLLPTFLLEFVPLADMLPTWTGCVVCVIRLRMTQQKALQQQDATPPIIRQQPDAVLPSKSTSMD